MEKLFNDAELFQKERPNGVTEQQKLEIFKEIAEKIIKNNWSDAEIEDIIEDLKKISYNDDGYDIAKYLDDYGDCWYDIDSEFVEYMDSISYTFWKRSEKNQEEWIKAHGIKPLLSKGTEITLKNKLNNKLLSGMIVYITGIDERSGKYILNSDKDTYGGTLIPFEKIENQYAK
jgi:hypothetical protein